MYELIKLFQQVKFIDQKSEVQINEVKVIYTESVRVGTDYSQQVTFQGKILPSV